MTDLALPDPGEMYQDAAGIVVRVIGTGRHDETHQMTVIRLHESGVIGCCSLAAFYRRFERCSKGVVET